MNKRNSFSKAKACITSEGRRRLKKKCGREEYTWKLFACMVSTSWVKRGSMLKEDKCMLFISAENIQDCFHGELLVRKSHFVCRREHGEQHLWKLGKGHVPEGRSNVKLGTCRDRCLVCVLGETQVSSFELRHLRLNVLNSCLLTVKAAPPDNTWFQFGPFSVLFTLGLWGRRVGHYSMGSFTSAALTAKGKMKREAHSWAVLQEHIRYMGFPEFETGWYSQVSWSQSIPETH